MDESSPSNALPDWLIQGTEPAGQKALATGVYDELRRIAARLMSGERKNHTLQATDLVHEAFLSLRATGAVRPEAEDRSHFLLLAARVMRRLLVDHARARGALKRGGRGQRITLREITEHLPSLTDDLCAVDDALERLAGRDLRKSRIVELRFFAGCSIRETAEVLGISHATVEREWKFARTWLAAELSPGSEA